jgi:hypothetical protein
MGKRVTVVCDDPAVQKMASESGFPVFGAVGPMGEGIPSEPEAAPPPRRWWRRSRTAPVAHVGIAPPTRLITKNATELKPGLFLLYVTAATLLLVGILALAIFVPSASVTLVAQAQPFTQKDFEITAQPGKAPIRVRADVITRSNSQGFKTTGLIQVFLTSATGQVVLTNTCSADIIMPEGTRFLDPSNQIYFGQTSQNTRILAGQSGTLNVKAIVPGTSGNVGSNVITQIVPNHYDCVSVTNPQATGNGADPSSSPLLTEADFDAGRAQLEAELRQSIAQQLAAAGQPNEKLSPSIIFGPPHYTTDHQPLDKVPSFSGTMSMTGEGDFYVDADVAKAFQAYLAQRVPTNEQLLTGSPIQVSYQLLNATQGGNLTFVGSASAYVAPKLDEAKIRADIVGRPVTAAKLYLQKLPIRSVTIKEQPIPLPLMPLIADRISLVYTVQSGAPSSAAASTTAPSPTASPPPSP